MLELLPYFDLKDAFIHIPEEHLIIPSLFKKHYSNTVDTLDIKSSSISVINYEIEGKIYISYFGFCNIDQVPSKATFFAEYHLHTNDFKILSYIKHHHKVFNWSINKEKTLIGFSIRDERNNFKIRSFIVETSSANCILFFEDEDRSKLIFWNGPDSIFLIKDNSIEMKNIDSLNKKNQYFMNLDSNCEQKIHHNVIWFDFDYKKEYLYIISKSEDNQKMFYVYSINGKNVEMIYSHSLDIDLNLNEKDQIIDYIKVVAFNGISEHYYCICQQSFNENEECIVITLHMLLYSMKIQYFLPIKDTKFNSNCKVIFDKIDELLLIYIPGYYVKILEYIQSHPPLILLSFIGDKYAPSFENVEFDKSIDIICLKNENNEDQPLILDRNSNILYKYQLNKDFLFTILDMKDDYLDKQAIYLALLYYRDIKLAQELIAYMIKKRPKNIKYDVFKCFLIVSLYNQFLKFMTDDFVKYKLSTILPLPKVPTPYTITVFDTYLENLSTLKSNFIQYENNDTQRYELSIFNSKSYVNSIKDSKLSRFKYRLSYSFRRIINSEFHKTDTITNEECVDLMRNEHVNTFCDILFEPLSKEIKLHKSSLVLANELRDIQSYVSHELYQCILNCISERDLDGTMAVLLNYHCAIEELSFPYHKRLYLDLCMVGYEVLPRHLFIQYIENQVFYVTKELLEKVIVESEKTDEDNNFINFLLSQLPYNDLIDIIKKFNLEGEYLLEKIEPHINIDEEEFDIDMEELNATPFLPLFSHIKSLETYERNAEYIEIVKNKLLNSLELI